MHVGWLHGGGGEGSHLHACGLAAWRRGEKGLGGGSSAEAEGAVRGRVELRLGRVELRPRLYEAEGGAKAEAKGSCLVGERGFTRLRGAVRGRGELPCWRWRLYEAKGSSPRLRGSRGQGELPCWRRRPYEAKGSSLRPRGAEAEESCLAGDGGRKRPRGAIRGRGKAEAEGSCLAGDGGRTRLRGAVRGQGEADAKGSSQEPELETIRGRGEAGAEGSCGQGEQLCWR